MKRRNNLVIGLISAALTIGVLFATVGKPPYLKHRHHFGQFEKCDSQKHASDTKE